jgi:outer membrane murein-binding lipoprotein Lpp
MKRIMGLTVCFLPFLITGCSTVEKTYSDIFHSPARDLQRNALAQQKLQQQQATQEEQQAAQKDAERKKQLEEEIAGKRKWYDQNISNMFYSTDNNVLKIGMSKSHVYYYLGYPQKNNRSVYSWGVREQLIYENWSGRVYLYLDDGVLSGWQARP